MKNQFLLDSEITFLNHGSFGACPKPVFEEYQRWQLELEKQPVQFMSVDLFSHLWDARNALGEYVGCSADDLVFVSNPTMAGNGVMKSLNLQPSDEVLSTDHEYGALIRAWNRYCDSTKSIFIQHEIPMPRISKESFVDFFWEGVNEKTKVIFMSQITSSTGLIFPVDEICRRARNAGILTIIDGAHVPGHIALNISQLNPDIYMGACHKWLCAPKGSSFLYVKKELQKSIKPQIVSWVEEGEDPSTSQFILDHQWLGTRDMSAFLTVPSAIDFLIENKWDTIREEKYQLTKETWKCIQKISGTTPLCSDPENWLGLMGSIEVSAESQELKTTLLNEYNIEIPVFEWKDKSYIRFSFHMYNDQNDADYLIEALEKVL